MPAFDRTGPEGKGSRTGRGLGTCDVPSGVRTVDIRPYGYGPYGWGRGRRWMMVERNIEQQPAVSFLPEEVAAMQRVDIEGEEVKNVAKDMQIPEEELQKALDSARTKAALALFADTQYII